MMATQDSFDCDCGRTFLRKKTYRNHRRNSRIHKPELNYGPFHCPKCPRRLPERYRMTDHQRTLGHSGMIIEVRDDVRSAQSRSGLSDLFAGLHIEIEHDLYNQQGDDLDAFIAANIQEDSTFKECCGEVINKLVRSLQNISIVPEILHTRRIIKSGSRGKGTAIKGSSDIDLVMMLKRFDDVNELMQNMPEVLSKLENFIKHHTTARIKSPTRFSVPAEVTCSSGHWHDVDILPGVDLIGLDEDNSVADVYDLMEGQSPDMIHEFSVSLAPLQLEIIGDLPPKVKNLIKLVKYWKNNKLKRGQPELPSLADRNAGDPKWPNSYALELVVMAAWVKAGEPDNFSMLKAIHAVLTSLVNHCNMRITFPGIMEYGADMIQDRSKPYIMDPANPYNDMYHGLVDGKAFSWSSVVPEARTWLSKPLFKGVRATEFNWN